jgi:hypothetical protein
MRFINGRHLAESAESSFLPETAHRTALEEWRRRGLTSLVSRDRYDKIAKLRRFDRAIKKKKKKKKEGEKKRGQAEEEEEEEEEGGGG